MKTEAQTVLESFTDSELEQCQQESLKWWRDLVLYGESAVDASSPFGRMMAAEKADKIRSVSPAEETARQGADEDVSFQKGS